MRLEEKIMYIVKRIWGLPILTLSLLAALVSVTVMAKMVGEKLQNITDILPIVLVVSASFLGILLSYIFLMVRERSKRIFLCYSFQDKNVVKSIAKDLEVTGYRILDPNEFVMVGEDIKEKVSRLIKHSNCIILFISKNMLNSRWANEELTLALRENKIILPVRIDDSNVPEMIKELKYIDSKGDYDEALFLLRKSIRSAVRKVEIPKTGEPVQEGRPTPKKVEKSSEKGMLDKIGVTSDSTVMNEKFQYCIKRISNRYKDWQWN